MKFEKILKRKRRAVLPIFAGALLFAGCLFVLAVAYVFLEIFKKQASDRGWL